MMRRVTVTIAAICLLLSGAVFASGTINILMEQVPETDYILELLPEFERATGIEVSVEVTNFNVMYEKTVTSLSSPRGAGLYDVIQAENGWVKEFADAGWMLSLDEWVPQSGIEFDQYVPSIVAGVNTGRDGQMYFLPFYHWSMAFIYRTDLMNDPDTRAAFASEFGYELRIPQSTQELLDWAIFMDDRPDRYGTVLQGSSPQNIPEFLPYFWNNGAEWQNADGVTLNSPEGIEALELYIRAFNEAAPPGAANMQFDQTMEVFSQGRVAGNIGYLWQRTILDRTPDTAVTGKVGIAPLPVTFLGAWGWGVPASARNPDAAFAFLAWVESTEIAYRRAQLGGEPTRYDLYADPALVELFPEYPVKLQILENAKNWPLGLLSAAAKDHAGRTIARAIIGELTPADAMNRIAEDQARRFE